MRCFLLLSYFLINCQEIRNYQNCSQKGCLECPSNRDICERCQYNYELYSNKCGVKCSLIKNCDLCDSELNFCLKCKDICKEEEMGCNCSERTALIVIISIIGVVFLIVIVSCIICNMATRKCFSGETNNSQSEYNNSEENLDEIRKSFLKNKIEVDKNIVNKKCMKCKINPCNLKYDCGCYICFDCDRKALKNKKCLSCGKTFLNSQQISCSLCFECKPSMGVLSCKCKLVLCEECYLKFREKHTICTICKEIIN